MAQDWLEAGSTVVKDGKALPDGSVVFNLPPNPADVAKEQRAADEKTFRILTAEEAAQRGLPAGGVYQANDLGKVETIQEAPKSQATENRLVAQTNAQNLLQAAGVQGDKDPVADLIRGSTSGRLEVAGAAIPEFFGGSTGGMENIARLETIVADMTLALTGGSLGAGVSNADVTFLKQRVGNLADPNVPADRRLAAWDEVKNRLQRIAGEEEQRASPLTPTGESAGTEVGAAGAASLTPEDMQLQAELSQAYQAGASLEELQAISAKYNRPFPIGSQQELDAARKAGRSIRVEPSGQRSQAVQAIGAAADTPVGAAFVGASNAILSGALDELAPIIGGDPATVQAAKEFLREKYPVSSVAGEIAGQAGMLAAGGGALKGAGFGARALAGAEVAQGAAYGAGESNENRLLGAGMGAGGAVVGQQIAGQLTRRLATPEAQAVVERVAQETGTPPKAVEQALQEALDNAAGVQLAQPVAEEAATEFGALAQKAVGSGRAARKAKEQLAVVAAINPEAKAAAERLGVELPLDVLSDDVRLLTTTGLARSQIGSDAQATWGQAVSGAIQRSDETLAEIGATRDLAQVSDDVRARLERDIADLETQGDALRREVDDAINPSDRVEPQALRAVFSELLPTLGTMKEAKEVLSAPEKKLLAALGDDLDKTPTYGYLNRLREDIGLALNKRKGPWADVNDKALNKYYGALAQDRLAYVESIGDKALADKMRGSNDLFHQMFKSRETMQSVFGQKLERDIGGLINRTITSAAKGDAQNLRTLMKAVPEDMQPRVLLSGLMSQAERSSAGGGFSFNNYAKMYRGLRQNSPIYAEIARTIGPEKAQILQDLYVISNRMATAEAKIVRTGASNQPILNALKAESLLGNIAKGTAQAGARVGGGMAGGAVAGPLGAVAGQEAGGRIADALVGAGKNNLEKMHALISSEGFRELTDKVAAGEITDKAVNRVANDGPFRKFAATVLGIKDPEGRKSWIMQALQASLAVGAVQGTTTEQPDSMIEVR